MKHALTALSVFTVMGCQSGPPASSTPSDEITIATSFSTDPALLRVGQFGVYSVAVSGKEGTYTTTLKVVGEDAEGLWIEQKVPSDPRPFILKSKVSRKGELIEMWAGEPRSPQPAQVYDRTKGKPQTKGPEVASVDVQETRETITVGGRVYDCIKLISRITYKDGRSTVLTDWCSPEAPFPLLKDKQPVGGVVRREYGRVRVELHGTGENAREELVIPKR